MIAYYSTTSGNTERFVQKLGCPTLRIRKDVEVYQPFILATPTYDGRVPAPVVRFLNEERNRRHIRGVIGFGNTSFGSRFGAAGRIISEKCHVPLLHTVELFGLPEDIDIVKYEMENLWTPAALAM